MGISFTVEKRAGYLYLHFEGEADQQSALEAYTQAFEALRDEGYSAVLLDMMDVHGAGFTTLQRHEQGLHVAQLQQEFGRPVSIAVAGRAPLIDPLRHGETVARNRGAHGKVLNSLEEAIAWIEADIVERGVGQ